MNLDKRYWYLIIPAFLFSCIASILTFHILSFVSIEGETVLITKWFFYTFGIIPSMIFGLLLLVSGMISIPYIFRQNESVGFYPVLLMSGITLFTFFDALNDISALTGPNELYAVAHPVTEILNYITYFLIA
jgi:hypothetical protein